MPVPRLRLPALLAALLAAAGAGAPPAAGDGPPRFNGTGREVMLQGFHWTSYDPAGNGGKRWYRILEENAGAIREAGFDYVWFPPPSRSAAGDNAYLPTEWFRLENGYGSRDELKAAIAALRPTRAVCDIVVNHRCGSATGQADFQRPSFGTAAQNRGAVAADDECGCGAGQAEERHQNGEACESNQAGRDLDHTSPRVQARVLEFLRLLKDGVGCAGWRYDQVRGYHGARVGVYNAATGPALSVGEFWDGSAQKVVDWIDETGGRSMAFDFPTRDALVAATQSGDYGRLKTGAGKPPGVIGLWPEMAVTFVENHDTEPVRDAGAKRFPDHAVMQGYAYVLTHPGIPCVFWRHFFDQGEGQKAQIRKLVALRKEAGIGSRSVVFIEPDTNGKYAAIVDGKVAMKIGPAPWAPGPGWTVAVAGPDFAVWTRQAP